MTFNQLRTIAKRIPADRAADIKLAVLGDTATQLLCTALRGYAFDRGYNFNIYEAEFDQVFSEILDENSGLYKFSPDYVLIYMSSEKLLAEFNDSDENTRADFSDKIMNRIKQQWSLLQSRCSARIIQTNFPENNDFIFGSFGARVKSSYIHQLRKLNYMFEETAACYGTIFVADLSSIQNTVGREKIFPHKFWDSSRLAISTEALPLVSKAVVDIICAIKGKIKKCVVLDLDNTLWGGVIGDDGLSNIQIGELGIGRAFSEFQYWLRELKRRGILLTVCSKNNEDTAKEPFLKHPDMVLRLDDFAVFVANWNDKASNIRFIQQTLNIGMDSIVFIDDNSFERNLVRELIPEITVPEMPEDPSLYLPFLINENLFETASVSSEDANRTARYQAEAKRIQMQSDFRSIDEYLRNLEMVGEAKPFDSFHIPRISQLTQRSNQFNLRTIRYSEEEIAKIAGSDKYLTLYFTLRDKFGDHGLISVVIMEKRDDKTLFVDTWLMSCRVLKRTVEEYVINSIIKTASENGFNKVIGEYIPTAKNSMVSDIYEKMGFKKVNDDLFEADVHSFVFKKCFIEEQ